MVDERNYLIHPHYLVLGLLLAGVTSLFLGFSGAYLYNRIQGDLQPLQIPFLFVINAVILICASLALSYSRKYYINDNTLRYRQSLGLTLILTLIFLGSQIIAWKRLYETGIPIQHDILASYLYIISFVHFAHVIIGIPFLAIFFYRSLTLMKEPVSVLVYFSDPEKKRHLNLLTIYWHFLDALWIYLVLFFLGNYLIS